MATTTMNRLIDSFLPTPVVLQAQDVVQPHSISAAWVMEQLRGRDELIQVLLALLHRLQRPVLPDDFGVPSGRLSARELQLVLALLPPGRMVHRNSVIAALFADDLAAGFSTTEKAHHLRVLASRARPKLAQFGWRLPPFSTAGVLVLIRAGDPLPPGYVETPRGWDNGRCSVQMRRDRDRERFRAIAERVEHLKARGLTQHQMARKLHTGQHTIEAMLRGVHWVQTEERTA